MLRKPHKLRVVLLAGTCAVLCGVVGARLYDLQVNRHDHYAARARGTQERRFVLQPERGEIVDRRGRVLATSTGTLSVYVWPRFFQEADVDLDALARAASLYTGVPHETLLARFNGTAITRVGRQMEPEIAHKVLDLFDEAGISSAGYWPEIESKRHYPRNLAPHLIGFCGSDESGDNNGLAGIEFRYNDLLAGSRVEGRSTVTGITQRINPVPQDKALDARGHTLVLTIDAAIQETAERAVRRAVEQHNADSAVAVVQDVETGAILALAVWPTYDNNEFGRSSNEERRNRVLTDPLETGSVAKIFSAAMLLDSGVATPYTMVDGENGRARIGPRMVTEGASQRVGVVPFYQAFRVSSNIAIIKLAQDLSNEEMYAYLRSFGLGQPTGIDLPGEGSGILRTPDRWDNFSRVSIPMGYEMSLTPIQIANAITGLVNGGELLEPYVVREVRDARGNVLERRGRHVVHRTVRPATSMMLREMMEDVVVNGSGRRAQIPGFRVGGKTGTTRKSHVRTHNEYISSFAGVLPIDRPKVTIYCYVDNPRGGDYYASVVATPMFREIAQAAVLHLGLVPDFPAEMAGGRGGESSYRTTLAEYGQAPLPSLASAGIMPDLAGLSMTEVRDKLAGTEFPVRFVGSGRVLDQIPLAGVAFVDVPEIVVLFDPAAPRAPQAPETTTAQITETRR